jgi:4-hydroxy-3-methylbut-2-enyl diphosphate reductase
LKYPGGRYLIVLDRTEAEAVAAFIRDGGHSRVFLARFGHAVSPGFDPDRDLVRVGLANQTTMLMSESLEVESIIRRAMTERYGEAALAEHFRAFDTICSATQDRQDAVLTLLDSERLDLMVVVGGYNSSNTCNLARLCAARLPTYHIANPQCLVTAEEIRHRPVGPAQAGVDEIGTTGWLPAGAIAIGLTAGASTPNSIIGRVVERLEELSK